MYLGNTESWKVKLLEYFIESRSLYEFRYAKDEEFGFTKEQDLEILYSLYPNAQKIQVIFSVPGEAHFVVTNR